MSTRPAGRIAVKKTKVVTIERRTPRALAPAAHPFEPDDYGIDCTCNRPKAHPVHDLRTHESATVTYVVVTA